MPGWAVVRLLGLGRDRLERLVLAIAVGRVLLAAVAMLATATVGPWGVRSYAAAGMAAGLAAWWRADGASPAGRSAWAAAAAAALAALGLVFAVAGRNGLPAADGTLLFHGVDATNDPLVYLSIARQFIESGLPLAYPFTGGASTTSTYLPYGVMAGLSAVGNSLPDVVFRLAPSIDAVAFALGAVALVRRLGGGSGAAALAGVLTVAGGEPSYWLGLLRSLGIDVSAVDAFQFFGPYLFAFNPVTPAMGAALAAVLLMAGFSAADPARTRRAAIVAGLLVASLFETKVFVFAPMFVALLALAIWGAPAATRRPIRLAAGVAAGASLPLVAEKLFWASRFAGRDLTAFVACPGCVPRALVRATFGDGSVSFAEIEAFRIGQLADPALWPATLGGCVLVLAMALGARAFGLGELWQKAQAADPGAAAASRWLGLAAALGLGAALLITTRPHYLNGLQFAFVATAGLWPYVALAVARAAANRRVAVPLLVLGLAAPGAWQVWVGLGAAAPPSAAVPAVDLALMRGLRAEVPPGDVVLEPSVVAHPDFPSPVAWAAGRSVVLTLSSASRVLPEYEREERHRQVATVFGRGDRRQALRALRASGAGWLLVPKPLPLSFAPAPELEHVLANPAGDLYRLRDAAPAEPR